MSTSLNLISNLSGYVTQQSLSYGKFQDAQGLKSVHPMFRNKYSPFVISLVAPNYQVNTQLFKPIRGPTLLGGTPNAYVNPTANLRTGNNTTSVDSKYGRNLEPRATADVDKAYLEALTAQLKRIRETPALQLITAPERFTKSFEPTVDYASGRKGTIVSMWLEKPMTISADGKTSAQYIIYPSGGGGLSNINRIYSDSYTNLLSLIGIYRNNGWVTPDVQLLGPTNSSIPAFIGAVKIDYAGSSYIGSFDSFNLRDDAEMPFLLTYDFTFSVRYELITLEQ